MNTLWVQGGGRLPDDSQQDVTVGDVIAGLHFLFIVLTTYEYARSRTLRKRLVRSASGRLEMSLSRPTSGNGWTVWTTCDVWHLNDAFGFCPGMVLSLGLLALISEFFFIPLD